MSTQDTIKEKQERDLLVQSKEYLFKNLKAVIETRTPKTIKVYSFRPTSEYMYNELYFSHLNCSPVSSFNDPLDCPLFLFLEVGRGKTQYYSNYKTLMKNLSKAASQMKIRCFSYGEDDMSIPINTLMWAHYANSHKGVLLYYEIPDILENDSERVSFFERVSYKDNFHNLGWNKLGEAKLAADLLPMVSTKCNAWAYENEVRLIHYCLIDEPSYPEIKIEKSYLKKVFFGVRTSMFDKMRFEQFARHYPDLELYDTTGDPDNLLALKSHPHKFSKMNVLDYAYMRPTVPNAKSLPRMVETMFRGCSDEMILDSNSLEEYLLRYEQLTDQDKAYSRGYVALYKKDKAKMDSEPETIEDLDQLVKKVMTLYYNSRRNIHLVREYLGISEYYTEQEEIS